MAAVIVLIFILLVGIGLVNGMKYDPDSENKFWLSLGATVVSLGAAFLWVYFLWAAAFFALATGFYVLKSASDSYKVYTDKTSID